MHRYGVVSLGFTVKVSFATALKARATVDVQHWPGALRPEPPVHIDGVVLNHQRPSMAAADGEELVIATRISPPADQLGRSRADAHHSASSMLGAIKSRCLLAVAKRPGQA